MSFGRGQVTTLWLQRNDELRGESVEGHVQEDGALTLDAWVCSEKTEEVGIVDDLARSAAAGEEEDDVELTNGGAPARFLRR